MPIAEFEETKITLKAENPEVKGEFIAKGKVQLVEGWRKVEKIDTKDTILPMVNKDENVHFVANKIGKVTKSRLNIIPEKTLLRVMETCGKGVEDKEDSEEMMASILSGLV